MQKMIVISDDFFPGPPAARRAADKQPDNLPDKIFGSQRQELMESRR
jgi:hypothetical protein